MSRVKSLRVSRKIHWHGEKWVLLAHGKQVEAFMWWRRLPDDFCSKSHHSLFLAWNIIHPLPHATLLEKYFPIDRIAKDENRKVSLKRVRKKLCAIFYTTPPSQPRGKVKKCENLRSNKWLHIHFVVVIEKWTLWKVYDTLGGRKRGPLFFFQREFGENGKKCPVTHYFLKWVDTYGETYIKFTSFETF